MSQGEANIQPSTRDLLDKEKQGEEVNKGSARQVSMHQNTQDDLPSSGGRRELRKQGTVQTNVDADLLAQNKESAKARIRRQLISQDSFADDFNFRRIGSALTMTYREGKADKKAALNKAGGSKKKDEKIAKDAKKLLWGFFGEQWPLLLLGFPFMFLGSLIEFLAPNFIGRIINKFREGNFEGDGGVNELIVTWMAFLLFSAVCAFIRECIFGITSQRLGQSIRMRLYSSIIKKDVNYFDNFRTGDMLSRLASDTQVVQDGLTTNVSMFVKAICIVGGTIVILFTYHPILAIIIVVCVLPQIVVSRISASYYNAYGVRYQKAKGEMSNIGTESLQNVRTVKAFADEEMTALKFALQSQNVFEYGRAKGYFWAIFLLGYKFLAAGGDLAIIYIISRTYEEFELTIGEVTAIMLYVRTLMNNAGSITNNIQAVAKVFGSSYEIAVLIVTPNQVHYEGTKQPTFKGDEDVETTKESNVDLNNVKFCYPSKTDVPVLKGVNIEVKKNQVVALVGQSGCGKSSIISLIERFYDPVEGQLLFSGEDIKDIDNKWYHQKQIALVQQEPVLFSSSIRDNILYGVDLGDATPDEITARLREACRQANALSFIEDKVLFPDGFNSLVGERGVRLSGGQKQRIAIARALVRKPKVILLDEATSALDAESEYQVQQALDILIEAQDQTCIVIAHRLSTIRNANKIIVMRKGEVQEQGTHDELIEMNGAYKKLVARQLMTQELGEQVVKGK